MPNNNVVFKGSWTEKDKVTIKYVAKDGGTVTPANETLNPDTGEATGSTAKANDGYRFVGWYSDKTCTTAVPAAWVNSDNKLTPGKPEGGWVTTTYYAKFESLTYTITFKTENGGKINDQTNDITYSDLIAGADFPTVPTTQENTGYYFDGWYKDNTKVTSFPEKVTENATYTAKWKKYDSVPLDLTGRFQKELTSDTATLPENANSFTLNIKNEKTQIVAQAHVQDVTLEQKSSKYTGTKAFAVESGSEMTFNAPGEYFYTVAETEGSCSGMSYDKTTYTMTVMVVANEGGLTIQSATIQGDAGDTVDLLATEVTNSITFHNEYTQPKKSINLGDLIQKDFDKKEGSEDLPTGSSYTFRVQAYERFQNSDGSYRYSNAPYLGEVVMTEFGQKNFVFNNGVITFFEPGRHEYVVEEFNDGAENVEYDSNRYLLVLDVADDLTITARNAGSLNDEVSTQSVEQTPVITFCNKYNKEKDPDKLTINFSDFVQKELTATGSKTADETTFIVDVVGSYDGGDIANALIPNETQATMDEDVLNTTLTATIKNIVGGNVYEVPFNGYVTVSKPGPYVFTLQEINKTASNVEYDDTVYEIHVIVEEDNGTGNLKVTNAYYYTHGERPVEGSLMGADEAIIFKNTIDTGKDDYYPIIIPTIINKDTGMLNKTDHFAYVIGYPDGTVHPNGQITRAEVATIFFRLLRDEVRDGAFTTSNTYSDVAYGKWYNNPISTMSALGIITGYPDGTFKPNKPITRAEFAAIAARFDETQSGKSATFSDVIGHWAAKEIGIAYYNDWIKGYPDGTFKPDQNITRAEAMTLINRVLERKPESPADLLTNMNKWTDNMDTSKWYYLDVQEATNSHGYTRKTFNYELWRQMLPDPDWSRYER
ncbi:MAG: S-layer homology domain-containing protein [Oscillospiraceae bacterium]|nr:S-layer homology domain-containing protein [Oscillospiraceae bacterium]